ncbi:hypothetical protein AO385_2036 [Moraxella catarrhalis]|uniref:Uncharacterized protein n=1 Tax=Moraxella catarrhalis TaxID=480 RepID=A0A198ULJ3_MORCA|nr:hypothetical protein AO385_2036 [Moraxella catarrhalis]OAU97348.1 hypothetical protein AO384_0730 [Moraxella catarrhalis]OAU98499.1 hypothetical protein AO383_0565 [Moraxella catarrhalis]
MPRATAWSATAAEFVPRAVAPMPLAYEAIPKAMDACF